MARSTKPVKVKDSFGRVFQVTPEAVILLASAIDDNDADPGRSMVPRVVVGPLAGQVRELAARQREVRHGR
jgi:hypothetical protein